MDCTPPYESFGVGWGSVGVIFACQAADLEKAKIAVTASFHPNTLAHRAKEIGVIQIARVKWEVASEKKS